MAKKKKVMDRDQLTTLLGAAAGAITAVPPLMDAVGTQGVLPWSQIVLGALLTGMGYFTNKK